jgi:hypothetical protein
MIKLFRAIVFSGLFFTGITAFAQSDILPNAYAHNDYWHKRPLLDALADGFTYVEADVYLRNSKLIVAHILPCINKKKTLESLYLAPLLKYVQEHTDKETGVSNCALTLMIDIKSDANKTYMAMLPLLEKYRAILSGYENGEMKLRNVTIVITGHKPIEMIKNKDNRLAFMDEDLRKSPGDSSKDVYPIASCKYSNLVKWKGKGTISATDIQRLEYYVIEAHKNGRKVRLWASPENRAVWGELLKCNVDLINTDRLKSLRKFLIADKLLVAKNNAKNTPTN